MLLEPNQKNDFMLGLATLLLVAFLAFKLGSIY